MLGWAPAVWKIAVLGALLLSLAIVVDGVVRRRWLLARDVIVALRSRRRSRLASLLGRRRRLATGSPSRRTCAHAGDFPSFGSRYVVAVLVVAGPELVRPVRVVAAWLLPLAAVGAVALGAASRPQALGGLALGLGAGAIVRLAFGSAAGVPPTDARTQPRSRRSASACATCGSAERQRRRLGGVRRTRRRRAAR